MNSPPATWISTLTPAVRWHARAGQVPVIVAEALERVDDPLENFLSGWEAAPPARTVCALVSGLRTWDPVDPPAWLYPHQRPAFAKICGVLARHGGCLLADPVGAGKTYTALAVAARHGAHAVAVVPAILRDHWIRTAQSLEIPLEVCSQESVSRGRLPRSLGRDGTLVVIDESHHFRSPRTRRYLTLAPALAGHTVLCLTATPIVNRFEDLASQLLLGIRDDALRFHGLPSIREHCSGNRPHPALGDLIVTSAAPTARPGQRTRRSRTGCDAGGADPVLAGIDSLSLSSHPAVAALVRGVLWRAWASSPAALEAALGRYLALLYHARDATRAGRRPGRAGLRRFIGEDAGQMVFWQLVDPGENDGDLVLADIERVSRLRRQVRSMTEMPDAKCRRLAGMVRRNGPSLVFCTARETVRYLRQHLPERTAWCTGDGAGVGPVRLPRERVLQWFSPAAREAEPNAPHVLVTTDVSAEGLNLQAARQIIHYDLPWTPMRLDQRDGRAVRLGSIHPEVLIHRFEPPAALEARLRQCTLLLRKRRLPTLAGIGEDARRIWRWRDELIARWGTEASPPGPLAATVPGAEGLLAGFRLESDRGVLAAWLGGIDRTGRWRDDAGWIEPFLIRAVACTDPQPPGCDTVAAAIHRLVPVVRSALRQIRAGQWRRPRQTVETGRLIQRLTSLARGAARNRDGDRLEAIERALAFTRRGHTAGERQLIADLAARPGPELIPWLTRCPAAPPEPTAIWPVLTGLLISI